MTYQLHPLCTLFPRMDGAEFDALCADIKANGLRQRIVLHQGMILDGGNRYRACQVAGVDPLFDEFDGDNIVSFVLSANLHRRHMSAGQQAAIVSSAQNWSKAQTRGGDRRSADQSATLHFDSAAARAAESGASLRTQKMADKVAKADPALALDVAHGKVSLPKAHASVATPRTQPDTAPSAPVVTQPDEPDDDGEDIVALAQELQADVERLQEHVKSLTADDTKAELMKVRRQLEHTERLRDEAMETSARMQRTVDRLQRDLRACGKAVGELDLDKVVRAVQAFARAHKVEAA